LFVFDFMFAFDGAVLCAAFAFDGAAFMLLAGVLGAAGVGVATLVGRFALTLALLVVLFAAPPQPMPSAASDKTAVSAIFFIISRDLLSSSKFV
jgi:hypothetical protein